MSEEEKKAIETVENFIKYYKKNEQTGNRANLDVLREECQAIEFMLNKYDVTQKELNNLKEIEQAHKADNGLLRQELDMQIEHNKELDNILYAKQSMIDELTQNEEKLKIELGKEKEKNNNLIKQLQEQNTEIQDISRQLRQEKEKYKRLQNTEAFSECYISKDKIKNILDKFNKGEYHYIHDLMQEIQELLEEK